MNACAVIAESADSNPSAVLRTLLLCDLVDSTGLVERLGDRAAAELIRKHDRLARTIADRHGGREIDKTDGFLMMFERPIQAVAFALDYQRGLKQLNAAEGTSLAARVGIHVGDVVVWDNTSEDIAKGAKPFEVEGLVKPITSRLMNLALPSQILLSNIAYVLAHRAQGELGIQLEKVRWRTHGRYRFRGIPDPVPVFEVGEDGVAPLKAPPWSSKAHREVPFWRRPATMVIEAIVLVALLTIPLVMFLRPEPAIAFANRDWVVVGNLQNLTGETVFDEALESALRIGLEQSRYVNVLPDLKVRDTVKRMQRDPDATKVDRAIGSEIAIRDGAKALILPTIAEIGGRVRITAEVIDPHTQTTVYSESADGTGAESVLPSLDAINGKLRVRLGEALATVSESSLPLDKVATKNLDALRAYSIGNRNYVRGQFKEALELYRQALTIDPDFAAAYVRIANIHVSATRNVDAEEAALAAHERRDRLAPRDALWVDSVLASLRGSNDALTKWAVLAETYPDFFTASGGFAYAAWRDANRFDAQIVAIAESSASSRNPMPLPARHLLGILHLGNGRYADAERTFKDAEADGLSFTQYHAATLAAQRRFDAAQTTLARTPAISATDNPAASSIRTLLETSFLVDQGNLADASAHLARARAELPDGHALAGAYDGVAVGLGIAAGLANEQDRATALRNAVGMTTDERTAAKRADLAALDARLAFLAYLAARTGDAVLAKQALANIDVGTYARHSAAYKLHAIAEAEIARGAGHTQEALTKLKELVDGSELYVTHVALLDAHAAFGQHVLALDEARWLAAHRGRAYAEANASNLLMAFNIEQANLAMLRGAEIALARKDTKAARALLAQFLEAWPSASRAGPLATRLKAVQSGLP